MILLTILTIIMLGCATIGTVYFIIFFRKARRGYQQKNWLKTYGRILDHELLTKWYHIYRDTWGKRYRVILKEYEYEVFGVTYIQREELQPTTENIAKIKLKLMPIGSKVEVYYNRQNPGEATIEPGIKGWDYFYLFYSILWMVGAGAILNVMYLEVTQLVYCLRLLQSLRACIG